MSIESFDPDQHRMDALTEGSGASPYVARRRTAETSDNFDRAEVSTKSRRKRTARPLGRAAAEVSGSDISRMLANQEVAEHPMSPEEHAQTLRSPGHLAFLAVKAQLAYEHSLEKAGEDERLQRAALRKLAEDK